MTDNFIMSETTIALKVILCACGCMRSFRALITSKQKYYSFYECDPEGIKKFHEFVRLEFESRG